MAIGGLNGFVSTEVQNSTSVLRLKFSAKNPAHRHVLRQRDVQPEEREDQDLRGDGNAISDDDIGDGLDQRHEA